MKNAWEEMDPDDISGYLMDYIGNWVREHNINDMNDFNESFQSDSFHEDIEELAETVVGAILAREKS